MEGGVYPVWRNSSRQLLEDVDEDDELRLMSSLSSIPLPQTPHEPMEFLARSSSLSTIEIAKALSEKQKRCFLDTDTDTLPETIASPQLPGKVISSSNGGLMGTIGKWFHPHKDSGGITVKKKEKARLQNARIHSALSMAGLAASLAAITSEEISGDSGSSKLSVALASATELLASYCIEMAELAGAEHDRVASTVRSAIDIQTPGDLMTLTAAAATALRADAVLRARFPNEPRKNASIAPCDRGVSETPWLPAFQSHMEERHPRCVGDLFQLTHKGALRWKRVSVYINKKSRVTIKLKSKHVGDTFSKKHKCLVYGICDEAAAWPYQNERNKTEDFYFGLKTAQGLLEFKCMSKIHKQQWVDGIESLLRRVSYIEAAEFSQDSLKYQ